MVQNTSVRIHMPTSVGDLWRLIRYGRKRRLASADLYLHHFKDKSGIEVGGPSKMFRTVLPIYATAASLDGVNFARRTVWEDSIDESKSYLYYKARAGRQFIREATHLSGIPSNSYQFLISSNCLEHIANPLRALEEWLRVVEPNGLLMLILPNKESNFDHRRLVTSFEHLLDDYRNQTEEDDLTHLEEILALHDLSRDPLAGDSRNFTERSLKNFENRCLHHHVFDAPLIQRVFEHFGVHIEHIDTTRTDYLALGTIKKRAAPSPLPPQCRVFAPTSARAPHRRRRHLDQSRICQ
jgi:SAM-dependent methyltransferase